MMGEPEDPHCDPNKPVVVTFEDVTASHCRIKKYVNYTACTQSTLSSLLGMEIWLKWESYQFTGSFKERGARYAMMMLSSEQKKRGVVVASAGNHAQGISYHGGLMGIPVTVVMPTSAPLKKISRCRDLKANVVVEGSNFDESKAIALKIAKEKGANYINGFDHPHVLAGNGTVGLEICEQVKDFDAVVVPTGGGGLLAGVSAAVKGLRPDAKVIAVETEKTASFSNSLEQGKPTYTNLGPTLADGLSVRLVGFNAFATAKKNIDKCIVVSEDWVALAILKFVEIEKSVVEGAGATALAAAMSGQLDEFKGKKVVLVVSGGNMDTTVLGRCIERGMAAEGRLIKLKVTVKDRPGSIAEVCNHLADMGVSIKDMLFERAWILSDVFSVELKLVCETRNEEHAMELINTLKKLYKKVKYVDFPSTHEGHYITLEDLNGK